MSPEGAGYEHDKLERRTELTRSRSPRSRRTPIRTWRSSPRAATCGHTGTGPPTRSASSTSTASMPGAPPQAHQRHRVFTRGGGAHARIVVPVSGHAVDSINLKNPHLGIYNQCRDLVAQHGVAKGRIRLALASGERHAGLTVNEYKRC